MRKLRLVAVILTLLLLSVLFFGCVEEFSVTAYTDRSGSVHRDYLVTYDADGEDAEAMKSEITAVMNRYVEKHSLQSYATIDDETEGTVTLQLLFPSLTDYYLSLGYTGREANEIDTPAKTGLVDAYDVTVDSYLTDRALAEIRTLVDEEYADFPLTADFYYTYGTTNRSTISNGKRTETDGVYYHTWQIDPEEPTQMAIRVYGLNVTAIYLIAISIFVLSLAIIFVIIYVNKRKEKARAAIPHEGPRLSEELPRSESDGPRE